jgi:hypothetical protein
VDWGCARKIGKETKGFIGSHFYAHNYIHEKDATKGNLCWKPISEFDKASLLYTLVVLSHNGRVPWRHAKPCLIEGRKRAVNDIVASWKQDGKGQVDHLEDLEKAANWTESQSV